MYLSLCALVPQAEQDDVETAAVGAAEAEVAAAEAALEEAKRQRDAAEKRHAVLVGKDMLGGGA